MIELDSETIMKNRSINKLYSSLFKTFKPGDRVIRKENQQNHNYEIVEGIIMSMDTDFLEVYWDKKNGIYCPEQMDHDFTFCPVDEVVHGNEKFSPIKPKKT
jgi:hypothetical protein